MLEARHPLDEAPPLEVSGESTGAVRTAARLVQGLLGNDQRHRYRSREEAAMDRRAGSVLLR